MRLLHGLILQTPPFRLISSVDDFRLRKSYTHNFSSYPPTNNLFSLKLENEVTPESRDAEESLRALKPDRMSQTLSTESSPPTFNIAYLKLFCIVSIITT